MLAPTGAQIELRSGSLRAVVTEVGGTLRLLTRHGEPIVWGFAEDELAAAGRGQVLAPFPNRLADGRYRFGGVDLQLPIDEPEKHNAIHGLVRWLPFAVKQDDAASAHCEAVLFPQPGYPFRIRLELRFELTERGLTVETVASNRGVQRAPFGLGFHPYLAAGAGGLDAAVLELPAQRQLVFNARQIPIAEEPSSIVGATKLAGLVLDDCFTGLVRDADGRWRVRFAPASRPVVALWGDSAFDYVMVFTADSLAPGERRGGLAVEPMTCPPNALASGESLVVLEPGGQLRASWGIEIED